MTRLIFVAMILSVSVLCGCDTILRHNDWPAQSGEVVLTFDDGPNLDTKLSHDILDVLSRHGVKGTFCYVDRNVEKAPILSAGRS